ncbi:hypothetical protein Ddc_13595 [Ditylenchus destructor]|nr:hypothetical protein Ddc_13595 [Ditylenchus destructor]
MVGMASGSLWHPALYRPPLIGPGFSDERLGFMGDAAAPPVVHLMASYCLKTSCLAIRNFMNLPIMVMTLCAKALLGPARAWHSAPTNE